jgi:hypothetical protein
MDFVGQAFCGVIDQPQRINRPSRWGFSRCRPEPPEAAGRRKFANYYSQCVDFFGWSYETIPESGATENIITIRYIPDPAFPMK